METESTDDLIAALQDPVAKELFRRVFASILRELETLHGTLKQMHDETHPGSTKL
jgi:hypothetical protein